MSGKLPALSFNALQKIKQIESFGTSCVIGHIQGGIISSGIHDSSVIVRDLRTCAGEMFGVYLEYYSSIGHIVPGTIDLITSEIAGSISVVFQTVLSTDRSQAEVRQLVAQMVETATKRLAKTQELPLPIPATDVKTATPQPDMAVSVAEQRMKRRTEYLIPILKEKGWTQSKWASETGIDPSIVYDYMKGLSNPRPKTRNDLADALGIKRSELPE
jgi:ribosome-binding protein aMBF1 (putative translation factor)